MIFDSGYQIEVLEGIDQGKKMPVRGKELTLGRKLIPNERISNWILFNDPTVSRIHAMPEWSVDENTYTIAHKSKTNPTLVNDEAIDRKALRPGDRVQMGLLLFRYAGRAHGKGAGDTTRKVEQPFSEGNLRETGALACTYQFLVTAGPDRGKAFPLKSEFMTIGGKGPGQVPGVGEVLLADDAVPGEHLFVAWNVKEGRYGVIKVESSSLPTYIRRGGDDFETELVIGPERHTLLEEEDRLSMGVTEMRFLRSREQGAKAKGEKSPENRHDSSGESKRMKSISLQLPRRAARAGEEERSPVAKPEKPLKKTEGKKYEQEKTDALGAVDAPVIKPDFQLDILSGPDKGICYSFLESDLMEERLITIGRRGLMAHAIELDEAGSEPMQAALIYRDGKLFMIGEGMTTPIFLNSQVLEPGSPMELKDGMHIQLGKTLLRFSDLRSRGETKPLRFMLMLIEGTTQDRGMARVIEKKKTTLGRADECDIVFSDSDLSPVHARVTLKDGKAAIELMGSSGLSLVNGVSLVRGRERSLLPGDLIRLSALTLLRLVVENPER